MTNAELMTAIAKSNRLMAGFMAELAEGAGNPDFCSASADVYATSIIIDVEAKLNYLKDRVAAAPVAADGKA